MIDQMKGEYPVAQLCQVLDCPRSSYYARRQSHELDAGLVEAIEAILMRWPFWHNSNDRECRWENSRCEVC